MRPWAMQPAGPRLTAMAVALSCLAVGAPHANGEDWRRLGEAEIAVRLGGAEIDFDGVAWQVFRADGVTLFRSPEAPAGSTSRGEWRVERDSVCSRWPGDSEWECYWVEVTDSGRIRFVDGYGNVTAGTFATGSPAGPGAAE